MTLLEFAKTYTTSTDVETVVTAGYTNFFPSGCTLSVWDNDLVTEDEELTASEISALNTSVANEVKRAIYAKNMLMSPCLDLTNERYVIYGKWMELQNKYNQLFQIQLRKFDKIWFKDYDIYHEGEVNTTGTTDATNETSSTNNIDSTNTEQSYGNGLNGSLTGDYPNNQTYTNGYATSQAKDTSKSESHGKNVIDEDTTFSGTSTDDIDTTSNVEDEWHEYRIGAMGRSPNFVQREAYNNVMNLVGEMANEFNRYFRFEWEKFDERCACEW